ncbi:MAG: S8 family serine peptidase [Candidatus Kapaibacterium sp.]
MKFFLFFLITFSIISNIEILSQSYEIIINSEEQEGDYFKPQKKYEIRKSQGNTYSKTNFYVKPVLEYEDHEINKLITNYLIHKGYPDINIIKSVKPFAKYFQQNYLKRNSTSLHKIINVQISNEFEIFDLCSLLTEHPDIEFAVPEFFYDLDEYSPNDSLSSKQWSLESSNILKAWEISKGEGRNVVIGIVDAGTDILHEDLKDRVWKNINEIPDDGIDNDGNGFVDDVYGWDFVGDISAQEAELGKFKEDNNVIPKTVSNDHGTHVAGIACASTDNLKGISSAAYNQTFLPVKIGLDDLNKSRLVYKPYDALMYAAANGAEIINCSWSSSIHDPIAEEVMEFLINSGVIIVASSGNEFTHTDFFPYYPANYDGVISVGSHDKNNHISSFSNYGVRTSIFAPGESILSCSGNNRYVSKSGTSMSSPFVTGVVSTLMSIFPNFSNKHILKQFRATSSQVLPSSPLLVGKLNVLNTFMYNNPDFPNYKVPGLGVDEILIKDTSAIIATGETEILIKIKNYLANAENIKVTITPQDNYFNFDKQEFTINELKSGEIIDYNLRLNLNDYTPWYNANLYFTIQFQTDEYDEIELHSLPILMESTNNHRLVEVLPKNSEIDWYDSDVIGKFDYWSVGFDVGAKLGIIYNFNNPNGLITYGNLPIYKISNSGDGNIMIASLTKNNTSEVKISTNRGVTFTDTEIKDKMSYVNGIKMVNTDNSFVYGADILSKGIILYSSDSGKTFQNSNYNFSFESPANDKPFTKPVKRGDKYYIGTDGGRIIASSDSGKSWELISDRIMNVHERSPIIFIAPVNKDTIFAVTQKNDTKEILRTTNGGASFAKVDYDMTNLNSLINLFVPEFSNTLYLLDKSGKIHYTSDFGQTWEAEPSYMYKFLNYQSSAFSRDSAYARLWLAGSDINYFDFNVIPANIIRDLQIAGENNIDFDSLEIQKSREEILFLRNSGNVKSYLKSQLFSKGTVFQFTNEFNNVIVPGELASADISFTPPEEGVYHDTLTIIDDNESILKFYLTGIGYDPTTVNESDSSSEGFVRYNRINKLIEIHLDTDIEGSLSIYDLSGKKVFFDKEFNHKNYSILNTNELNVVLGWYFLVIDSKDYHRSFKLLLD